MAFNWRWQQRRELGLRPQIGGLSQLYCGLYSNFKAVQTWEPDKTSDQPHHGGIFNFDFSPEGSMLVAACERQSILLFDPFNARLIGHKSKAHTDCVNCVRFLDSRVFATCSDDTTVSLWDVRFLRHEIRTLRGHSNWVKNIEYDAAHSLLLTSGFDGSIYTWDINSYSVNEPNFKRVFHTRGLMRSKLTPDSSKLVISTTEGYLIVIHNLDLSCLEQDLRGFKPKFYRFMQLVQTPRRNTTLYNHVFERHRNRVEFISDFPGRDEACVIASLQIHPQGWCCLSRNTSSDENSEWTCLHDIQEMKTDLSETEDLEEVDEEMLDYIQQPSTSGGEPPSHHRRPIGSMSPIPNRSRSPSASNSRPSSPSWLIYVHVQSPTPENSGSDEEDNVEPDEYDDDSDPSEFVLRDRARPTRNRMVYYRNPRVDTSPTANGQGDGSSNNGEATDERSGSSNAEPPADQTWHPVVTPVQDLLSGINPPRVASRRSTAVLGNGSFYSPSSETAPTATSAASPVAGASSSGNGESSNGNSSTSSGIGSGGNSSGLGSSSGVGGEQEEEGASGNPVDYTFIFRTGGQQKRTLAVCSGIKPYPSHLYKIHKNRPRLLYYSEEPNVGRGFIKELCFSPDGRLICSPFGFGTRLLAFNPHCLELPDCVPSRPLKMCEVTCTMAHSNVVVTAKFSPTHCMYVAGCLNGRVTFHQPVL